MEELKRAEAAANARLEQQYTENAKKTGAQRYKDMRIGGQWLTWLPWLLIGFLARLRTARGIAAFASTPILLWLLQLILTSEAVLGILAAFVGGVLGRRYEGARGDNKG